MEVDELRESHTVPQDDVEHLDARYRPPPDVPYFVSERKKMIIYDDR